MENNPNILTGTPPEQRAHVSRVDLLPWSSAGMQYSTTNYTVSDNSEQIANMGRNY